MGRDHDEMRTGRVRVWHPEKGWGIVDLDSGEGKCLVIFSDLTGEGFRELHDDDIVRMKIEEFRDGKQHGCRYRPASEVELVDP
ncbi:Cold shock protein, CspA family [Ruaniaceae bacterium KH17]|nr:Cold shock protein, CspA family [Ruaniaceae bacterium KH17]